MAVRPYKRKGIIQPDKWMIDYYDAKRSRQRMILSGTRAEADALETDLRKQHASGPRNNPTINAILPEYLTWMRNHRSPHTVQDIEWSLVKLQPHFGPYQINRITRPLIEDYKAKRLAAGKVTAQGVRIGDLKPRTVNKELAYLSSIIGWMVEQEYCYPLPFKIKKLPSRRPLPKIPSHQEIEAFIAALGDDPMKQALAGLLYDCGLRWAEGSRLRWEDINWQTGTISVKGKGSRERTALLSDRCRNLLAPTRMATGGPARDWIFVNPATGEPYGHQQKAWKTAAKKAGVRITPHLLRHAYATYTLEATGDLRAVQTELGHASVSTSEIYTHVSQSRRREVDRRRREYLNQALADPVDRGSRDEKSVNNPKSVAQSDRTNSAQVIDIAKHLKLE